MSLPVEHVLEVAGKDMETPVVHDLTEFYRVILDLSGDQRIYMVTGEVR